MPTKAKCCGWVTLNLPTALIALRSAGDITRDEDGLKTLRALAEQLRQIEAALTVDRDKGQLPKKIAIKADTSEANPFN